MEAFCENLGDEIVPYMDPLMEKLLSLLRTANRQTQVTARPAPPTRRPDAASAATRGTARIPSASWPLDLWPFLFGFAVWVCRRRWPSRR